MSDSHQLDFRTRFQLWLEFSFEKLGQQAARTPWRFIGLAVVLSLVFGMGTVNMHVETDGTEIWVPRNSGPYLQRARLQELFEKQELRVAVLTLETETAQNVLTPEVFATALELYNKAAGIKVTYKDEVWDYERICEKAWDEATAPCLTHTPAGMFAPFNYDPAVVRNQTQAQLLAALSTQHAMKNLGSALGSLKAPNGAVASASSFAMRLLIRNPEIAAVEAWEQEFLDAFDQGASTWKDTQYDGTYKVERFARRSFDDEVLRLVTGDQPLFVLALLVLVIYLMFTLGRAFHRVESKIWLAWSAMGLVLLANLAAFGIVSAFGMSVNAICFLVPFISLGVGVDDLIIIVDSFKRIGRHVPEVKRSGIAMADSGSAITQTSLTSVLALAVAVASTDYPGIQSFCAVASAAFFFKFAFGACMMFPAMVVLDERRVIDGRHSILCCMAVKGYVQEDTLAHEPEPTAAVADAADAEPESLTKESTDHAAARRAEYVADVGEIKHVSPLERFISRVYAPWLSQKKNSLVVLVAFTLVSVLALVAATTSLEKGLPDRDVLPDDSYIVEAFEELDQHFGVRINAMDIVFDKVSLANPEHVTQMERATTLLELEPFMVKPLLPLHRVFAQYLAAGHNESLAEMSPAQVRTRLAEFLDVPQYKIMRRAVAYDAAGDVLALRIATDLRDVATTQEREVIMDRIEAIMNEAGLGSRGFGMVVTFLFAYADAIIFQLTLLSMASALIAVIVLMVAFLDTAAGLWIGVAVLLIDIDLFGWMAILGVKLNAVSFVTLMMAVGLSVDYCVHLGHSFLHHKGTREERALKSLQTMGTSVFKGALTSGIGVLVLAGASSVAFRTFFQMLFGTVIFGAVHGLAFLPAVLNVVGPNDAAEAATAEGAALGGKDVEMGATSTVVADDSDGAPIKPATAADSAAPAGDAAAADGSEAFRRRSEFKNVQDEALDREDRAQIKEHLNASV